MGMNNNDRTDSVGKARLVIHKKVANSKPPLEQHPNEQRKAEQSQDVRKTEGTSPAANAMTPKAVRKRVVMIKKSAGHGAPEGKVQDMAQKTPLPKIPEDKRKAVQIPAVQNTKEAPAPKKERAPMAVKAQEAPQRPPVQRNAVAKDKESPKSIASSVVQRAEGAASFDFNAKRPNIKAGNLSVPRTRGRSRGGMGQYRDSFTGSEARASIAAGGNAGGRPGNGRSAGYPQGGRQAGYQQGGRQGGYQPGGRAGFFGGRQGAPGGRPGGRTVSSNYSQGYGRMRNRPGGGMRFGAGGFNPQGGGFGAPPSNAPQGKKRQTFKGKKQVYNRKEDFDEDKFFEQRKKTQSTASVVPKEIDIMESISVSDLARKMNLKASEIIAKLMSMGMMVTINQSIDADTATLLASEYGTQVNIVSLYDETVIESEADKEGSIFPRAPIVTVMGHVDHGKTKTLDAIRHSHVAEGEAGGITQHIGAYSVTTPKGRITFLDTPGHEAFTMMRARGAQVTDIVVLVVAADDGVMPQTLEALSHAKDAKVPIIVAINKIDKSDANPDHVMTQLSEQGLTPEEWGGDTQYVRISALKGEGIDELLDAILLQAEMLELKADWDCRAEGKILESRIDAGRGIVSSIIIQRGTLRQGDPFVAGIYAGHVRAIFDDLGRRITEAEPSMPVEVLGMESMPNAGDPFQVTESERDAREVSAKRQELKKFEQARTVKKVTLENLYQTIDESNVKEFKVIIKADLQGSAEALKSSLEKLSTNDIRLVVIHSSAGAINESDVTLAAADSNAIIIAFNVRPTPKAKMLAEKERVEIRKYSIIYKVVDEVRSAMEGMLTPDTKEQIIGTAEVRDTFKVPKVGVIAGVSVTDGAVRRGCGVNLVRDGIIKYTGTVISLRRFKDDAKEVTAGFECGVGLENWQDIQTGDTMEYFEYVKVARKLGEELIDEKAQNDAAQRARETESGENADA